jgi:hypothetical protein
MQWMGKVFSLFESLIQIKVYNLQQHYISEYNSIFISTSALICPRKIVVFSSDN